MRLPLLAYSDTRTAMERGERQGSQVARAFLVVGSLTNALFMLTVQLIALVYLSPADFGRFAFVYLFYGACLSVSHSLVIDVWVRSVPESISWRTYAATLGWVALGISFLSLVAGLAITQSVLLSVAVGVGTGAGVYRNGARFYAARLLSWRYVIVPDAFGTGFLLAVFLVAIPVVGVFDAVLIAWASSQAAAALITRQARPLPLKLLRKWFSDHWAQIRQLWLDSSLLDASVIVTPLVVSAFLSLPNFGIYRAISSSALPVRLILAPLRPNISGLSLRSFQNRRATVSIFVAGAFVGTLVTLLLWGVGVTGLLPESILPRVADYAFSAGIFACGNLVSTVYYVAARSNVAFSRVRFGRYVETVVMVLGPLIGLAFAGLGGAVWGFSIGSVLVAASWAGIVRFPR